MATDAAVSGRSADPAERPRTHTPVFAVLDPLRAVGALAVVTTHATFWSGDYLRHGVFGSVLARLDVGVAIFFVLSGFLLSHHFLARAFHGAPRETTGRYFWKRFLRIYPAYLIGVVLAMMYVEDNAGAGIKSWFTVLLMGDIYVNDTYRSGQTQMWSLATEVAFYVLLPLLIALVTGFGRHRPTSTRVLGLVAAMVAFNVLWTLDLLDRINDASSFGLPGNWLPSYLMWFAAGIALAWAHILREAGRTSGWIEGLAALGRSPGVCWAMAAGLLVVAATPLGGPTMLAAPTVGQALTKQVLYALIGALLVVTGVFNDRNSTYTRIMSRPLLRHLGHISYGVFCLHLVVLHFVMWITPYELFIGTNGPQILGLTLLITLPLAELLYRLVELPAMRLRNVGRRAEPTARPSASSTRS
ncbi:acyltransferase family protein [Nocardioides currus]|uniref:acyltransferase family protein n=1 Tax=Nocardioides currus TaxID=2133958 RepID=UPI00140370EF|nr:acyltransferase [Nocardioides currus]